MPARRISLAIAAVTVVACSTADTQPPLQACIDGWNQAVAVGAVSAEVDADTAWLSTQEAAEWEGGHPVCWLQMIEDETTCQLFHADRRDLETWRTDPVHTCVPDHVATGARRYVVDGGLLGAEATT